MTVDADTAVRYAIYFVPGPEGVLGRFGRYWFAPDGPPEIPGLSRERLVEAQTSARHYGFHATMKAPFRPAPDRGEAELRAALDVFAAGRAPLELPPLRVTRLGAYLTLRPDGATPALGELAADCVRAFEPMRAPLNDAEIARRRQSGLTPHQDDLMQRWGYPYVMDEFRFHMTLAGPLNQDELDRLAKALEPQCRELSAMPFVLDRLSLCRQAGRRAPFSVLATSEFGGMPLHRSAIT